MALTLFLGGCGQEKPEEEIRGTLAKVEGESTVENVEEIQKVEKTTEEIQTVEETTKINIEDNWKDIYLNYFNKDNYPNIYVFDDLNGDGIPEICFDVDIYDSKYAFIYINKAGEVKMSESGWIHRNDKYIASDSVYYEYNESTGEYDIVFNGYANYEKAVFKIDGRKCSEKEYSKRNKKYVGIELWDISDPDIMKSSETLFDDIKNYGDWKYTYIQYFTDEEQNYAMETLNACGSYGFVDIDRNGVPEIVISLGPQVSSISWIKDGSVCEAGLDGGRIGWNKKTGNIISIGGNSMDWENISVFSFDIDKGLETVHYADWDGWSQGTDVYTLDNKECTKKEYESFKKSCEKGCTWIGGETANFIGAIQTY